MCFLASLLSEFEIWTDPKAVSSAYIFKYPTPRRQRAHCMPLCADHCRFVAENCGNVKGGMSIFPAPFSAPPNIFSISFCSVLASFRHSENLILTQSTSLSASTSLPLAVVPAYIGGSGLLASLPVSCPAPGIIPPILLFMVTGSPKL